MLQTGEASLRKQQASLTTIVVDNGCNLFMVAPALISCCCDSTRCLLRRSVVLAVNGCLAILLSGLSLRSVRLLLFACGSRVFTALTTRSSSLRLIRCCIVLYTIASA